MHQSHVRPLAGFRDKVTELTEAGSPLGDVEDAIDAQSALTEDQKAALWLLAFSLRDRSEKRRQARALFAVARAAPGGELGGRRATERPRPREFDARGFPVPQHSRSFLERVARLLHPE